MQTVNEIVVPAMPSESYWGLVVAPWSPDELYGVCANWADGACQVYELRDGRWAATSYQVATYRHEPRAALADALLGAIMAGDGPIADDDEAWDQAERLALDAIEIGR